MFPLFTYKRPVV